MIFTSPADIWTLVPVNSYNTASYTQDCFDDVKDYLKDNIWQIINKNQRYSSKPYSLQSFLVSR